MHIFSFICATLSKSSWDTFQAKQSFVESFITLVCRLFLTSTTEKNYVKLKGKKSTSQNGLAQPSEDLSSSSLQSGVKSNARSSQTT